MSNTLIGDYVSDEQCPICRHRVYSYLAVPSLLTCTDCALTYARERKTTVRYDEQYVAERYDRYPTTDAMSALRLRVLEHNLYMHETLDAGHRFGVLRGPLLDVGYGNGSFIRRCLVNRWDAYGCDVNETEYEGVRRIYSTAVNHGPRWRAVTFFDSLEHFETFDWIRQVADNADWILVSAPLPPPSFPRDLAWKHYRPGEHHYYFHQPWTFERIFPGARVAYVGTPEDSIRGKLMGGSTNIQTVLLRCPPQGERADSE